MKLSKAAKDYARKEYLPSVPEDNVHLLNAQCDFATGEAHAEQRILEAAIARAPFDTCNIYLTIKDLEEIIKGQE